MAAKGPTELVNVEVTFDCSVMAAGAGLDVVVVVVVVLPQAFEPSEDVFDPGDVEWDTPSYDD